MTEENDRRNRSNFSEVGLALLDGPAWWIEKIWTLTLEAICSTQESFYGLWIFVYVTFYYTFKSNVWPESFQSWHQKMRQIDIFRKVIRVIQNPTVFPKPYMRVHTHTHTHTHTQELHRITCCSAWVIKLADLSLSLSLSLSPLVWTQTHVVCTKAPWPTVQPHEGGQP
jgi:hypothetical protein